MQNATKVIVKAKSQDWDNTYQALSWWKSETIQQAKVMVVGAGALGNEVLKNLTLLNVGHVLIVDFDHIEYSNLSRSVLFREKDTKRKALKAEVAAERIKEINSNLKVQYINGDITIDVGLGIFRRMDVIIGCLDNRLARLFLNRLCFNVGKTWIDGAIENLIGQVNVYQPPNTCYECSLTRQDWKGIRAKLGCPDVVQRNLTFGRIPTTPISASIVAAIQTQEALKVVCGNKKNIMLDSFYYEGMNNLVLQLAPTKLKDDCHSHVFFEEIISAPLSSKSTISDTLDWLGKYLKSKDFYIKLDNSVALKVASRESDKSYQITIPKLKLTEELLEAFQEKGNEEIYILEETDEIDFSFKNPEKSLNDLGVPPLHIIRVYSSGEVYYVELSDDESFLNFC